jgi:hypothetical protein
MKSSFESEFHGASWKETGSDDMEKLPAPPGKRSRTKSGNIKVTVSSPVIVISGTKFTVILDFNPAIFGE